MSLRSAVEYLNTGKLGRARRELRRCLPQDAEAAWACKLMVQSYWQRGLPEQAAGFLATLPADAALASFARGFLARCRGDAAGREHFITAARGGSAIGWAAKLELAAINRGGSGSLGIAKRCEQWFRENRNLWGVAAAVAVRATLAVERFELGEALKICEEAAALRRQTGDLTGLAWLAQTEAKARFLLADYDSAFACLSRALEWQRSLGHALDAGIILNNIGLWHLDLASPELARVALLGARKCFARIGDRFREAATLANLASARQRLGDRRGCERDYRRALALLADSGRPDAHGIAVAELAEALTRAGQPQRALASLKSNRRSSKLSPAVRLLIEVERARALLSDGSAALALRMITAAQRRTPGNHGRAVVSRLLADTVRARAMLACGDPGSASRVLRRTCAELEALLARQRNPSVRMGLVDAHRDAHDSLVAAMLASGARGTQPAFAMVSGLKARELRERRLEAPRAWRRRADPREVIARIPHGTALLEYHVAHDHSRVFVASGGRVSVISLPVGEAQLGRDIARLLEPLVAAGISADPRAELFAFELALARRLYDVLLAPALRVLGDDVHRLVVVPDGPLHALPFDVLVSADQSPGPTAIPMARFETPRYVLDDYEVSYARSSLLLGPARSGSLRSLLALAYSPSDGEAAPLPGTRAEVAVIARSFPEGWVLTGRRATPRAYRDHASGADVIHIAAHAFSDVLAPERSRILLAPADGRHELHPGDIGSVGLRARLVTLSACDSGSGRVHIREGIVGLSRAFLEAGAEAVLASLWPVDDAVTATLMKSFYRRLAAGTPRAEALALARRELRQRANSLLHAHPFFWGAWVMIDHSIGHNDGASGSR